MLKKTLFVAVFASLLGLQLSAEDLPKLAPAPEITTGSLPNGIRYYLVANPRSGSYADCAVIQKDFSDHEAARSNLVSLPHFGSRRPCDFLSDHGVSFPQTGYVSFRGGHTHYDFPSVPMSPQEVCDSTLMMLLDIASTCPGDQALVISGGIDVSKLKERLALLAIAVPARDSSPVREEYRWVPLTSPSVYYSGSPCRDVSTLRVSYSSARIPSSRMGTAQPVVTRQYSMYLESILSRRIRTAFRAADIPLADLQYRYRDSAEGPGNELYTFTVSTSTLRFTDAVRTVAAILADMDNRGVTSKELEDSRKALVTGASRDGGNIIVSDAEYVVKCTRSFLYGASLASDATVNDIFARSSLSVSEELPIFNLFVSALLDPVCNLVLGFDTPGAACMPELESAFFNSWRAAAGDRLSAPAVPAPVGTIDTSVPRNRSRVEESRADALTGGTLMRLSDGLRVVCRKTGVTGEFMYSFMVKGASALPAGEAAFLTDLFGLCEVSGMSGERFREALMSEGVIFTPEVTGSDLRVVGLAPKSKMPVVLKALRILSGVTSIPEEDFRYYKSCEALRLKLRRSSPSAAGDVIDSLLYPGGAAPGLKQLKYLGDALPGKAMPYLKGQLGRFSGAVLSIVGDFDDAQLEKQLCQYLGDIPSAGSAAARPRTVLTSAGGRQTLRGTSASGSSAHFAWTFLPVADDGSRAAVRIACAVLEKSLSKVLSPLGYSYTVGRRTVYYPQERETISIDCTPCPLSGLPAGVVAAPVDSVAEAVESLLADLSSNPVPDISALKSGLASIISSESSDAGCLTEAVLVRYAAGKDIMSGAGKAVSSLSPQQVQSVFREMSSGRYVNYLVQ